MRLRLTTEHQDQLVILKLEGELDLAAKMQVTQCVERLVESGSHDILVDLTSLQFGDSSGLSALLVAARACRAAAGSFGVFGATESVARVLEITGLDRALMVTTHAPPPDPEGSAATGS